MRALLLGAAGLVAIAPAARATQAMVAGEIRDQSTGRPLVHAAVVLADVDRSMLTDASGAYAFRDVPTGPQHVVVRAAGYETRTLHALVPASGRLDIDAALRPAPIPLRPLVVSSDRDPSLVTPSITSPDRTLSMLDMLVDTSGSFEWGVDGALPGIQMWADPSAHIGEEYRQEFYEGEAEDFGTVLSVGESITVETGSYTGCVKTEDRNGLDPDNVIENKWYCPNIGFVFETKSDSDEEVELVEIVMP